jgi:glycylpeptide N-tetradecanoyltransferase
MPHRIPSSGAPHPEGPIVPNKPPEEIRAEPYTLPTGFAWRNVDIRQPDGLQELYLLLSHNYVEDDEALFRFDYSPAFLSWALQPPNGNDDFLFGVVTNQKLVAFISGIPTTIQIRAHVVPVVEINFLCIHKKLRSKRLAPVLIKEMTRRANQAGIFQAVYTAGTELPVPLASARYYHRNLHPQKLVRIGFSRLGPRMTMARLMKLYQLPSTPATPGWRPLRDADVPAWHALLTDFLARMEWKIRFTEDEVRHWFLPRDGVVQTHVRCGDPTAPEKVTDGLSFYHLPSHVLQPYGGAASEPGYDRLYAAYSFYNVATTVPLPQLLKDALILARASECDVYNCLTLMEQEPALLQELKFGPGDGTLHYYLYNWAPGLGRIPSHKLGIVLL